MLAEAAQLASLADETPEGRSIVRSAGDRFGLRDTAPAATAQFVPFTAQTRMSGVDLGQRCIRKGALDAVERYLEAQASHLPPLVKRIAEEVARRGATPLIVTDGDCALGGSS